MPELEKKSLQEWMLEKGFTQRSLSRKAKELGYKVSDTSISLVVTGKRTNVRADTMGAVAAVLGIQIRQISEFDEMIDVQLGKDLPVMLEDDTGRGNTNIGATAPILASI